MIMNIGSLLGACAAAFLAKRAGRRVVICAAGILGCLTALAFALFADQTALILILGATFQFFAMLTNTTLAAWSPELYPTTIRALGTSIVNGIGNIAGAIMPFAAVALFAAYGFAGVFGMVASCTPCWWSPPGSPPRPAAAPWKRSTRTAWSSIPRPPTRPR